MGATTSGPAAAAAVDKVMASNRTCEGCRGARFPSELQDDGMDYAASGDEPSSVDPASAPMRAPCAERSKWPHAVCCRRRRASMGADVVKTGPLHWAMQLIRHVGVSSM